MLPSTKKKTYNVQKEEKKDEKNEEKNTSSEHYSKVTIKSIL